MPINRLCSFKACWGKGRGRSGFSADIDIGMNREVQPSLSLSRLFNPSTVALSLQARDRDGVFAELIGRIPDLARKAEARGELLRALQERESLCTTAFGFGMALPHTRNIIPGVLNTIIVFGRHSVGIPYGRPGAAPVQLFFLVVAANVRAHLEILAKLSRLLQCPELRRALLEAQNVKEVIASIEAAEESILAVAKV